MTMYDSTNIDIAKLTVLIADDSESERIILSNVLQQSGHKVLEANNGRQALDIIAKNNSIDLLLLDINMPEMDGLMTATKIRELESQQNSEWLPIIFLSGKNTIDDVEQGIKSGGDDYLYKPINAKLIKVKIFAMSRLIEMRRKLIAVQKQLEQQALYDELTKIPNRRHFFNMLESEISRSTRYNHPFSIVYVDIDHFKQVNDTRGHHTGDVVLKNIAQSLQEHIRTEDKIGRLGGEEFCILLPLTDTAKACEITERYRQHVESIIHHSEGEQFNVTASFGCTQFVAPESANAIIKRADSLLYKAKSQGRNCVIC